MGRILPLTILFALLAGCAGRQAAAPPTPAPAPTAAPAATAAPQAATPAPGAGTDAAFDAEAVRAAIQATLDDYARAYSSGDEELLRSTVDQSNAPFRRLAQERFNSFQSSIAGGSPVELRAIEVRPRDLGFVQATVESGGGSHYDWLFREVDGRWVLSEPAEKQLGERIEIESEHFVFLTYPWADDVNGKLVDMMERARSQVETTLGTAPAEKYTVVIRPIFGLTPPADTGALAWYQAATRPRGDRIQINAPGGYHFGAYDPAAGWDGQLYQILVHEYTHLVHLRSFPEHYGLSDWMSEGLADYVAERPQRAAVSAALAQGKSFPIVDRSNVTAPQDLDHLSLLQADIGLAYGFAYALVAYIVEEHGGLDGFWKLAGEMRKTPGTGVARYDGAMQAALGVSFEEFDAGWRAWLEANY